MVSKRSRREFSQRRYSNDRLSPQQQIEQNIQQYHRRDDPYRRAADGSVEISSSNQKQDNSEVVLEAITDFTHKYADATCSTEEQFAYAQEHFHKSHEFQQLTREQQDWFKQNLQKQDNSEYTVQKIVDEIMAIERNGSHIFGQDTKRIFRVWPESTTKRLNKIDFNKKDWKKFLISLGDEFPGPEYSKSRLAIRNFVSKNAKSVDDGTSSPNIY